MESALQYSIIACCIFIINWKYGINIQKEVQRRVLQNVTVEAAYFKFMWLNNLDHLNSLKIGDTTQHRSFLVCLIKLTFSTIPQIIGIWNCFCLFFYHRVIKKILNLTIILKNQAKLQWPSERSHFLFLQWLCVVSL